MSSTVGNHFKFHLASGDIDFDAHTFVICLMQSGFIFNKDTHHNHADIAASELASGNGYTQKTKALAGVAVTENDTDDRTDVTWSNVTWLAGGGVIGPSPGAIVIDETEAADVIVGYIDFGGDQTEPDGGTATISNISFRIA
jgi:hypothetical protein